MPSRVSRLSDDQVIDQLRSLLNRVEPEDTPWRGFVLPDGSIVAMDCDVEHRKTFQVAGVGMARAQQAGAARAGTGLYNAAAIEISRPLTEAQRRTVLRMSEGALFLYVDVTAGSRRRFSGVAELGRGQLADQFAVGGLLLQAQAQAARVAVRARPELDQSSLALGI